MSQAFQDNNRYEAVREAMVILRDEDGNEEILTEAVYNPGLYMSEMMGVVGKEYYLTVIVDDKEYEASAVIPNVVHITDVFIYDIKAGDKSWFSPSIMFDDPEYEDNYYYTLVYINGRKLDTFYLYDDEFRNGKHVHKILFFNKEDNQDNDLETGDEVMIEMQSIDKGMYRFYETWTSFANGGAANPISNISGGALGCFKAYNTSTIYMVVSAAYIYSEE
jgi:hypothetical protein